MGKLIVFYVPANFKANKDAPVTSKRKNPCLEWSSREGISLIPGRRPARRQDETAPHLVLLAFLVCACSVSSRGTIIAGA